MTYTDSNQIGAITETTGVAKIIRTDGSEVDAKLGVAIYQGDIVETQGDGAVNIEFTDESAFAVSDNARITIDEFVFDPETEGGVQDFSVARGVFMYTSGLIGRENPDSVEIDTPVGAIGIRGTIIGGDIQPGGESQVTVIEGAIVVRNDAGERLLTNQFDTVNLTTRSAAPSAIKQMDVREIADSFSSVKDVSSSLFSSFQDQMQQQDNQDQGLKQQDGNSVNDNLEGQEAEEKSSDTTAQDDVNSTDEVAQADDADSKKEDKVEQKQADKDVQDNANETVEQNEDIIERMEMMESMEKSVDNGVETLEESAKADMMDMSMDDGVKSQSMGQNKKSMQMSKENNEKQMYKEHKIDQYEEIAEDVYVRTSEDNVLKYTQTTSLSENADGSSTPIELGQISVIGAASNIAYALGGADASQFMINAMGKLFYIGSDSGNYEQGDSLRFVIRARDLDSGNVIVKHKEIYVQDVNEKPRMETKLSDTYDVTNDINALVKSGAGNTGQKLTDINFHDPEGGSFSSSDVRLLGSVGGQDANIFFEVINDGDNIVLQLRTGVYLDDMGGGNYKLTDGTTDSGVLNSVNSYNIGVQLNDNDSNYNYSFKFAIGNTENVTGSTEVDVSSFKNVHGNGDDNVFRLDNDDFKIISGGRGHDVLILDGANGGSSTDVFDFTNTMSNLGGNSADLKSIEEIRLVDSVYELKINIPDIIDLLKTSENHELIIANGASPDGTDATEDNNGIFFKNDLGVQESLVDNGFSYAGTVTESGETFQKFTHDGGLGDVLIEADINGAAAGGL